MVSSMQEDGLLFPILGGRMTRMAAAAETEPLRLNQNLYQKEASQIWYLAIMRIDV